MVPTFFPSFKYARLLAVKSRWASGGASRWPEVLPGYLGWDGCWSSSGVIGSGEAGPAKGNEQLCSAQRLIPNGAWLGCCCFVLVLRWRILIPYSKFGGSFCEMLTRLLVFVMPVWQCSRRSSLSGLLRAFFWDEVVIEWDWGLEVKARFTQCYSAK